MSHCMPSGANDPAREPAWASCGFEDCRSPDTISYDMGLCDECEEWYCDRHGDENRCAACWEKQGIGAWLGFLAETEPLGSQLRYRVRFTTGRAVATVPFLTSTVALAYAAEKEWRVAEEFDGKAWLRFSENRTERAA